MKKILLVQGANLNYLGKREPEIYGTTAAVQLDARALEAMLEILRKKAEASHESST
jgi:3-dehydroquinate dehydratase-2